jgi:hypothetical protein
MNAMDDRTDATETDASAEAIAVTPELDWTPWHTWTDGATTRVDGRLRDSDRRPAGELDVAASSDECCDEPEATSARRAWKAGRVLFSQGRERHGVDTLVVGPVTLTSATIAEALSRYGTQRSAGEHP